MKILSTIKPPIPWSLGDHARDVFPIPRLIWPVLTPAPAIGRLTLLPQPHPSTVRRWFPSSLRLFPRYGLDGNGSVSGVLSYNNNTDGTVNTPTDYEQITWADGTITNYVPLYAMMPASEAVLGNLAAPGNASANPFNADITTTSDMLLNRAPLTAVQTSSTITAQTNPQFWSTPVRAYTDTSADIIEVRFSGQVNVNAISFQLANFPHTAYLQVYDDAIRPGWPFTAKS